MRKLGIAILVIVVLLIAAAFIIPHIVNINDYHAQIQSQLEKKLGRQVSLGPMSLSLFPPSFQVSNAVIGEDKNFNSSRPFATADKLSVSVKLMPLLRKDVDVKSLQLERPHIELIRNARGEWNFATLGQESKPMPAQKTAPENASPQKTAEDTNKKNAGQIELANLGINDGQVAITDLQKHQSRAVYDHIDLSVNDFAPDKAFSIKAAAHLPGQGKQAVYLEGKGGPIQQADMLNTNFDGTLRMDQVSLSAVEKFLNSQALNGMDALLSGDAKVKNAGGKMASNGTIKMENPRIHNVNVGYPITLDYDVADDLTTDVIQIHRGELKLGSTPVTIAGTVNTKPTPAQLDVKLTAANASIAEAARLASAFGVAFNQGMDVNGRVNANIQAKGAADKPSMNGQLSARDLVMSGRDLPQPVKVNAIDLTLTPETIHSNDFTATTGSTSVTVNFSLAQYTTPNSIVQASLKAPNARLGEVLNIAKAYGVSAVEGMSGDGQLSLDVQAQGPTKNPSALNFNGSGKLQNASLKVPSLTKPVQIRNSDLRFSQNSVILQNVAASLGQTNTTGALTLKNFAAPQVQFTLNADKVNVAELQQMFVSTPTKRASVDHGFWSIIPAANAEPATAPEPSMLTKMTGSGTVGVGTVQYDDLVLNNVHTNVGLDHGLVHLNPVTADLYGGKETGTITVDMRPAQPVYTVNLKTDKVDANKLISSVSSVKQMLYGLLNSNVNASFSSTSADAIARGLNGNVALNLTNGKLANLDLLHELATVGKFLGGGPATAAKGFTNLVQLSGNFDVKNGVAQTNNLKAVIDGGTLAAAGLVNLADQSLNMHVTAVLNKAMSQQAGGTQIGGFMNTALANNQGELVMPVIVTGTFQHPQIAPDVQQLAKMKLDNLLPTSKNPGALTSGIVGAILGNKNQPADSNGTQPNGGIGGIVGAITGKKQPNQQSTPPDQSQNQVGNNPGQQQQNPFGDVLNKVLEQQKKKKQQPQQQPPPQQ
ncbi:MAG: hypothetical protein DMG65_25885 [Candidatus Angelobacter sp. Gp1-AA117]|nr:MAG: hypothetical protein DMG65_25885 [Candidatus Angelobacter sp. Gp1-AA117]